MLTAGFLLLFAGLIVFLRQPVMDNAFCDPDVAGVAYSSQELLTGGDLYGNTVETKPPLSYLFFALLFKFFGQSMSSVYAFSMAWHIGVMLALYFLAAGIGHRGAGLFAAFLYALYSTAAVVNGPCPNFETWTLLPTALLFLCLWRFSLSLHLRWVLLAGVMGGMAMLAKQTVLVLMLPSIAWLWYGTDETLESTERRRIFFRALAAAFAGFLIPLGLTAAFFAARGGLGSLWRALHPQGVLGYVATENAEYTIRQLFTNGGLFLWQGRYLLLTALLLFLTYSSRLVRELSPRFRRGRWLAMLWLAGAIPAVEIGTKFFDHYFIVLIPPLCLAAGIGLWIFIADAKWPRAIGIFLAMILLGLSAYMLRWEIAIAQYGLMNRLELGKLNWTPDSDYFWFTPNLPRYMAWNHEVEQVGRCIRDHTLPEDRIYVWDYEPGVYWFAQRRAPTRHFMYFTVAVDLPVDAGRWLTAEDPRLKYNRTELMRDLHKKPPAYIVTLRTQDPIEVWPYIKPSAPVFPELGEFIQQYYEPDLTCASRYFLPYRLRKTVN